MQISVIIPTLEEADQIASTIGSVPTDPEVEIIVADGGSLDRTREIAADHGAQVFVAPPGRGPQMNAGARQARGEVLIFLHADTRLPYSALKDVRKAMEHPKVVGGAFRFRTDGQGLFYAISRIGVNVRSAWLGLPFGDQALFVRSSAFEKLDGYRDMPACEDLDLVRRLHRLGRVVLLASSATTSSRDWEEHGRGRVYWHHFSTFIKYYLGRYG